MKAEQIQCLMNQQLFSKPNKQANLKRQAYCPFMTRSKRQFPINKTSKANLDFPAPGAYSIESIFDKRHRSLIKAKTKYVYQRNNSSTMFRSKKKRFFYEKKQGPDPCTYKPMVNTFSEVKKNKNTRKRNIATSMITRVSKIKGNLSEFAERKSQMNQGSLQIDTREFSSIQEFKDIKPKPIPQEKNRTFSSLINYIQTHIPSKSIEKSAQKKIVKRLSSNIHHSTYNNYQKIKKVKRQNKKYQEVGPGWYNIKTTFSNEKRKSKFQFFLSSSVRFYKKTPIYDNRRLYYQDTFWKNPCENKKIEAPEEKSFCSKKQKRKSSINEVDKYKIYYTTKKEGSQTEIKKKYFRII